MRRPAALLAVVLALPGVLTAQGRGMPLMNSGVPSGLTVAADVGFPGDELGGGTALGASVNAGIGVLGLGAQVVRQSLDDDARDAITSVGGTATLRLFGGPLVPFRVQVQGGYARWNWQVPDLDSPTVSDETQTRVTAALGFAATIPVPAFAIRPWIAPRIERLEREGSGDTDFGISGGIELGFLNGMTLRTAYDRTWVSRNGFTVRPGVWSIGLGKAL